MPLPRVFLLGIPVDPLTRGEAVGRILSLLRGEGQHHVATPNSEMLVEAARNPAFFDLLRSGELNLPDSAGLKWAARWTGQRLPERVTGVDTVVSLCAKLDEETSVYFLGGKTGIAERAAAALKARNPRLFVAGCFGGSPRDSDAEDLLGRIRKAGPRLLLVAYGAPAQDLWIAKYLRELPSVRVAMGVGGTFDFLAGEQVRSPLLLQRLGLEWLWRVLREPRRARRIWNAVAVFPSLVLRHGRETPASLR